MRLALLSSIVLFAWPLAAAAQLDVPPGGLAAGGVRAGTAVSPATRAIAVPGTASPDLSMPGVAAPDSASLGISGEDNTLPVGQPRTLVQALVEAYANNATLQEQRAVLRQTDEQVPTALSGWRPTITVTGSYGHNYGTESEDTSTGSTYDPTTGKTTPGGSETVDISLNHSQEVVQGTLSQPIYSGGRTIAQTREAENRVYAARANLLASEGTVFMNVVNAYVGVITDDQILALDESNEQVLSQQLQATTDQFNIGEITLTSVAQAQASLAQAKEQVEVAAGNAQIARETFRELVGDYPGPLAPPQPLALPVKSRDDAATLAMANNPNVIAAEFTDAANKDAVDVAFAQLLPQVTLQASGFHEVSPSGSNVSEDGGSVVGEMTFPLYQGGSEYAAIRQARATQQQSFATIIDAERTAIQTATQAWTAFVRSRDAIVATNAEIKANAIALDGTEREEIVGTQTTLDVLNAQQLLLNSQVQQVQNISSLVENSYTVAQAIGRLTVTDLGLPVSQYDDRRYYESVKWAAFGTGEEADRRAGIDANGTLVNAGLPTTADAEPGHVVASAPQPASAAVVAPVAPQPDGQPAAP